MTTPMPTGSKDRPRAVAGYTLCPGRAAWGIRRGCLSVGGVDSGYATVVHLLSQLFLVVGRLELTVNLEAGQSPLEGAKNWP